MTNSNNFNQYTKYYHEKQNSWEKIFTQEKHQTKCKELHDLSIRYSASATP